MTIEMQKIGKVHFLKHYLGGPAMVLDQIQNVTGQIENVEIEDGSVLIKSGMESHWYDCARVSPSLKSFKQITSEDLHTIIDHLKFGGQKMFSNEILSCDGDNFGILIILTGDRQIWITPNWSIVGLQNIGRTPDNIGTIIFLLCELGYDVIGQMLQ